MACKLHCMFILCVFLLAFDQVKLHFLYAVEIEDLQRQVEEILRRIQEVKMAELYGQTKITTKQTVATTTTAPDPTGLDLYERKAIRDRLDKLNHTITVLENYVKGERMLDTVLEDLSGKTMDKFESYMDTVKGKAENMKKEVKKDLKPAEDTLSIVEGYANDRNVVLGGILYYLGIGSGCAGRSDICRTPKSECRDNKCQCLPGLSSNALDQTCVSKCNRGYGDTYQTVHNYAIRGFNDLSLENVTLEVCKKRCEAEKTFVCKSFDYFPEWNSCFLSSKVKCDVDSEVGENNDENEDDALEEKPGDGWEYNAAAIHFQRDCLVQKKLVNDNKNVPQK